LKRHKSRCDEERLRYLDQRKWAKIPWLRDPNDSNVVTLNIVRHEASRHFRKKEKEYLKAKTDELETNSKIKKKSETGTGASVTLRRVTSLELM